MKKIVIFAQLVICILFSSSKIQAQYFAADDSYFYSPLVFEVGASLGSMNCLTDIGGNKGVGDKYFKDLNLGKSTFCLGGFVNYTYKSAVGARLEAAFGKVMADDQVLKSVPVSDMAYRRYNRNLNFQSNINEFSLTAELHPLFIFINWVNRDKTPPRYSPYLLGGIGYFSFNPKANLQGRLIDLQPLSTEGQGFDEYPDRKVYQLKQFNYPLGVGVKYDLSSIVRLRAEFVYRILNTDYLDDVSKTYINPELFKNYFGEGTVQCDNAIILNDRQIIPATNPLGGGRRGISTNNDSYFSANLKISMVLGAQKMY